MAPSVPLYRLIGDHGHPAGEYEAPDDEAAEQTGRQLSQSVATARTTGFRVERYDGDLWRAVRAWMPTRVRAFQAPPDATVPPADPDAPPPPGVRDPVTG